MKIKQSDQEKLVVVDAPYLLMGLCAFSVILFLSRLVRYAIWGPTGNDQLLGVVLGLLVSGGAGYAFGQRSAFTFDRTHRQLCWSRRSLFCVRRGTVPFNQISAVTLESLNSEGTLTYRIALKTAGETIPLTTSYSGGGPAKCEKIRLAICAVLETNPPTGKDEDIRELIASGRRIDAIQMAAERHQLDLTQAKEFVDKLAAR